MQGMFNPVNPKKIKGDPKGLVYRSSWELKYMMMLDTDPNVIEWGSECIIIPYRIDPMPNLRRYFIDFFVKTADGKVKLIEIKPASQTLPPKPGKKRQKTVLKETMTYAMNQAKWKAARIYCDKKGWEFQIMTENDLGIKR